MSRTAESLALDVLPDAIADDLPAKLPPVELLEGLADLLAADTRRESTRESYASDVRAFERWAVENGLEQPTGRPVPPVWVAAWVVAMSAEGKALATVQRRVQGLAADHKARGYADPTAHPAVKTALSQLGKLNTKAQRQAHPLVADDIARIVNSLDLDTLAGARDAAMILVGWSCALRVSELAKLDHADLAVADDRIVVTIQGGKARNRDEVEHVHASCDPSDTLCPVIAVRRWLDMASIESGPVFRGITRHATVRHGAISSNGIADVLKRLAKSAGVAGWANVTPHSLRRGWATQAATNGAPAHVIRGHGRWKTAASADRYVDVVGSVEGLAATRSVISGVTFAEALNDVQRPSTADMVG